MVNDREKECESNGVSDIPIGDSESCVRNDTPTTSPNDDGNKSTELERKEDNTLCSESTTPLTINTNSSRSNHSKSSVSTITASTVRTLMPPLDSRDAVEMKENESENVDVSVVAVQYETLDDGSITSIPEQPELRKLTNVSETNDYDDGCDSDGEIGPFYDAVVNELEIDNAYVEYTIDEIKPPPHLPPVPIDVLCACLDRCVMPGLRAFSTHKCAICKLNIHGICGVPNPSGDESVTYSQNYFSCHEKIIIQMRQLLPTREII